MDLKEYEISYNMGKLEKNKYEDLDALPLFRINNDRSNCR